MSPADLATLSLLEPDQGVCPNGHPCRLDEVEIGYRRCSTGEYVGSALACWDVTPDAIEAARRSGADAAVTAWAEAFLADRP